MPEGKLKSLVDFFADEYLRQMIFSNPIDRDCFSKVRVRPVMIRGELRFQAEEQKGSQAFHRNLSRDELPDYVENLLTGAFRQLQAESEKGSGTALVGKKGTVTVKMKKRLPEREERKRAGEPDSREGEGLSGKPDSREGERLSGEPSLSGRGWEGLERLQHNRQKNYLLKEGVPVPFLVDLGVMTPEGKIVRSRYDKFRQINRFLEFIEDILPKLHWERENQIIDFGCGKSYLTFAMYHYLKIIKGYSIHVVGLDLKKDVIGRCNMLAQKYGYDRLFFYCGDIADYEGVEQADMVVTLHACDTATDYALEKAVRWGAKVILAVPCCQHELNQQIKNDLLKPVLGYGIIKERMAALITDALRAELLEAAGYRTQILEFIEMEHTPKNLLIRAVKEGKPKENQKELDKLMEFLQVNPAFKRLLSLNE
ncbi:SAM-dependent methyltransferase [Clostridiaceae bacterium]|nr:SAM-dependent methyltransferase [Clostridiaceae bacterium]